MKKITIKHFILFIGLTVLGTSCIKTDECGECFTPPPQLVFKVVSAETGENLYTINTYDLGELKLYYFDGDETIFLNVEHFHTGDQWLISSIEMSWLAISDSGETFYLELDPNTIETIHLKIVSVFENCCTFHQIDELLINGEEAEIEPYTNVIIIRK